MNKIAFLEGYINKRAGVDRFLDKPGFWEALKDILKAKQLRKGYGLYKAHAGRLRDASRGMSNAEILEEINKPYSMMGIDYGLAQEGVGDVIKGGLKTGGVYGGGALATGLGINALRG